MAIGKKTAVVLAGAVIVAAGVGVAQYGANAAGGWGGGGWGHGHGHGRGHGKRMTRMLMKADANKDGEITMEEIETLRDERFGRFDSNDDGVVEAAEIEAKLRARMEERLQRRIKRMTRRFDADRDGKITKEEFNRFARERFTWADLNDDGKIAEDELPRRMKHWMKRHGGDDTKQE